ncbi:basal body-orientation factor 1-like isoform X7 [Phyllopteryx taeniolatus]|uniref:basal body-orientation factor 1-like isoform X7 n=1 Tax=Phyllopteryx taeniolatus TaxID=161469 RepID=UPI002AD3AD61|nr:basal body-orientation factor 1-like isoform X7 [Phyllopteryx taeniolatus]
MHRKKVIKVKKTKTRRGKKSGQREPKTDKEFALAQAKANIALWELKLRLTEETLAGYRESCGQLARANDQLSNKLAHMEREILDVSAHRQRQDAAKNDKVNVLHDMLKSQEGLALEQQNKLIRKSMEQAEEENRENCNKMEYRFFKEKAQLEREAEQMIAQVEEQAHHEAVLQLDDASRCVFKENVRLNETLKHHMKEAEELHKLVNSLTKKNTSLAMDKKTLEMLAKINAAKMVAQKEELTHLKEKVASLEQIVEHKREEQECRQEKMLLGSQAAEAELEKLQWVLSMRENELKQIKRLASGIMEQRTELERFFYEALAQVKEQIAARGLQYKKEAQRTYQWTLKQATAGRIKFPPIRTFQNTNSVYSDIEKAAEWMHQPGSQVDISDLTWEQKEQVLRLLFAKMNSQRPREEPAPCQPSLLRRLTLPYPPTPTAWRRTAPHDLYVASLSIIKLLIGRLTFGCIPHC